MSVDRKSSKPHGHRIEAAMTRDAIAQPQRKAMALARRISERAGNWERQEIARAEAAAARLQAQRDARRAVMAENVSDGTKGPQTA